MSGEIGFHLQEEIIKRLPVKLLVRFRSVCKAWRCLINSCYFIAAHTVRQDQWQHLLVRYGAGAEVKYVYIVDDDTFPQQRFVPTLPLSLKLLKRSSIVGSCNGLLCFDGYYYDYHPNFGKPMVVLWNPSIRKSIAIPVPVMSDVMDETAFGFGVCPVTNDPKIVMITQLSPLHEEKSEINNPRKVMVYELSTGIWRSPCPSSNVPSKSVRVTWCGQVIDRFMYWSGSHEMAADNGIQWTSYLILSFDMTNDVFEVIDLPESLALHPPCNVFISKLRKSLVILAHGGNSEIEHCAVWKMEDGVQKSFTKLFTVIAEHGPIRALGFRKNGTPIIEVEDNRYEGSEIVVYEPNSQHFNDLEIFGLRNFTTVSPYMELLLLLGRADCNGY